MIKYLIQKRTKMKKFDWRKIFVISYWCMNKEPNAFTFYIDSLILILFTLSFVKLLFVFFEILKNI